MMGKLWACSGCVQLAVLTVLARVSLAAHDNGYHIHRLEKDYNVLRHPKREASCGRQSWTLCPASVEGGCCPDGYACAVSSCFVTTAGPTTACGNAGYYNCPLSAGPGSCCPVGTICRPDGCSPPIGVDYSQICSQSYFACPSSLGGGCCPDGMVCGSRSCYATTPETHLVSATLTTTNSNGRTITTVVTSTAVLTHGPDPSASSATTAGVPKLVASTIAKEPAIETDTAVSSASGGLTQAQLGGIIGGVVILLIAIITAAIIIIRRLKRTEEAAQAAVESRHESSSGQQRSQKSGFGQTSISEIDGTDMDSIARAGHYRNRSDSSTDGRSRSETLNFYGSNASSTPPPAWPARYFSELPPSNVSHSRQSSQDSYGSHHNHSQFVPRTSVDSQGTHAHARQWSIDNASEVSGSVDGNHGISELESVDGDEAARRRSSIINAWPKTHGRRISDPPGISRVRGDGAAPLGTLSEVNELHGHYGPANTAVGQTAEKLHEKNSSRSSLQQHNV